MCKDKHALIIVIRGLNLSLALRTSVYIASMCLNWLDLVTGSMNRHYENLPIQIYRIFSDKKL